MRIVTTDTKQVLMDRLQCMRDFNEELDSAVDDLVYLRGVCCGYISPSSASSSSSSVSSVLQTVLTEDSQVVLTENSVEVITENN